MEEQKFLKCKRCNRKLKTELAQKRGYGDYCWKIHQQEVKNSSRTLFDLVDSDKQ